MVQRGCGTMAVCNSFNDNILRLPIGNSSNVTSSCTTCDKQNCNNNSGNGIFLNKVSMAIILLYFGMKKL